MTPKRPFPCKRIRFLGKMAAMKASKAATVGKLLTVVVSLVIWHEMRDVGQQRCQSVEIHQFG